MPTDRFPQLLKLYEIDPTDADIPYMIALEHAKAGQSADALDWLDKAIAADADHLYAYYQKGRLLAESGHAAAACEALNTGLQRAQAAGDAKAAGEINELLASVAD